MFKAQHVVIVLLSIILIQAAFLIFRKAAPVIEPFDDSALRQEIRIKDSIADYWEAEAIQWKDVAHKAVEQTNVLENRKPTIKIRYREKYRFNSTANTQQLDSIVRTNW